MSVPVHSDNLREYYVSAAPENAIMETIELRHPSFDQPARVVNDGDDFVATLEADAPANGGEDVTFLTSSFTFEPPESSGQGLPSCDLVIDNAARALAPYIRQAKLTRAPVELLYRQYLADDPSEPGLTIDGLTINRVTRALTRVTASVAFEDVLNQSFPSTLYTTREWTGLDR